MPTLKVMITGVHGLIGMAVYEHLVAEPDRYEVHGLARRRASSERMEGREGRRIPDDRFVLSDLSDLDQVRRALEGMDVVVHMAADPRPDAPWEDILNSNVIGTYHTFEGSRQAGVKRVITASSGQATLGYHNDEPYRAISEERYGDVPDEIPLVTHLMPTRPQNAYGCSKVWGEALARVYADSHGMSCIALRIGWVVAEDRPPYAQARDVWCSRRDIVQLVERCINAPDSLRFDLFYGMSDDRYRWVDIDHAREVVGYVPQDRAADWL